MNTAEKILTEMESAVGYDRDELDCEEISFEDRKQETESED